MWFVAFFKNMFDKGIAKCFCTYISTIYTYINTYALNVLSNLSYSSKNLI